MSARFRMSSEESWFEVLSSDFCLAIRFAATFGRAAQLNAEPGAAGDHCRAADGRKGDENERKR